MTGTDHQRPSVVVLAKNTIGAKTRLQLPRDQARQVALALATSTVRTVVSADSVGTVLVVTGDPDIARDALHAGAAVVAEPRPLGINLAAAKGRRQAFEVRPSAPVAVMVADLPYLLPSDIDGVVDEFHAIRRSLFVADRLGDGTTFLIHGHDRRPGIRFGQSSASKHRRLGYQEAHTATPGLRSDLDNREDFERLDGRIVLGADVDGRP
ncbi:MAG: hypothetical protein ACJ71Z_08605 [Aeromicrobium sp.]